MYRILAFKKQIKTAWLRQETRFMDPSYVLGNLFDATKCHMRFAFETQRN